MTDNVIELNPKRPTELNQKRYTVACQSGRVPEYVHHVDFKKCNEVSKRLYRQLTDSLSINDEYKSDDVMIALAMMVARFGNEMTMLNPLNEWASDGFPEFCSLIGPDSGFRIKKVEKTGEQTDNK